MTREQLETKRTEILTTLGIASATFGDKSVQYSEASKALAVIDNELSRLDSATTTGSQFRTSFVSFTR